MSDRLIPKLRAAELLQCNERTVNRYIEQKRLTGYPVRVVGPRGPRIHTLVDLAEVQALHSQLYATPQLSPAS